MMAFPAAGSNELKKKTVWLLNSTLRGLAGTTTDDVIPLNHWNPPCERIAFAVISSTIR